MDNQYKHIVLHFDQAQQPKFKENKQKNWVEFGEKNDYPNYLLSLYNESPKHGAIIKSKTNYVYGQGFENEGVANASGETWNNIVKRCIKDDELYRGYYLQVIWNRIGQISDVYHIEFAKVRVSKDLKKFYVKNDWTDFREKPREYDAFNVNYPVGSQIFYYKEYNPISDVYPIPSYQQGLNYICSDIQVSRHILGNSLQGFVGSTLINLNSGDPLNEEHRGEVERGLLKKFTGSEGKRVVIMFNKSRENSAEVIPLGNTMLTKEDFTNVNTLIQSEIYASHQVVTPALFGIATAGTLGQRNEIRDGYEIFNNVYVKERQQEISKIVTNLRNLKGEQGEFKLIPLEPLKFEFSEAIMAQNLTKDEIRELMGKEIQEQTISAQAKQINDNINSLSPVVATKVLELMTEDEIRNLAGLPPKNPIASETTGLPAEPQPVQQVENTAIKNLTGRQYQNVMRIVRQFGNGKLNKEQASMMLKSGFGFTDEDVNTFLGIDANPMTDDEPQKFSAEEDDERMVQEFASCGDDREKYEIIESKLAIHENFADWSITPSLSKNQANVLDLMTKDSNITPQVIADTLKLELEVVKNIIDDFVKASIIELIPSDVNINPKIKVLKPVSSLKGKDSTITELVIRYTYEGPEDNRNRPFCAKMLKLSETKMWGRADIESISARLGYSVWDRRGGWYTLPSGKHRYYCRHRWVSNLVKLKS